MSTIPELYQQIADMTLPKCKMCPRAMSCCDTMYCEIAKEYALFKGVVLEPTNFVDERNPKNLPFMSATGCVVPPHLRPMCSMHTCGVNSMGVERTSSGEVDVEWTTKYFQLREQIEELEFKDAYPDDLPI